MATKYKQVLKVQKKTLQKIYDKVHDPNKTVVENTQKAFDYFAKQLDRYQEKCKMSNNKADERMCALQSVFLKAIIDDMNGTLTHFFIKDKNLITFLMNTEVHDTSIVQEFLDENKISIIGGTNYLSVALHTEETGLLITYLYNEERTVVCISDENNSWDSPLEHAQLDPKSRLAVNLIYYLKAYPEKILDGVPQDMVRDDKKKLQGTKSFSIEIADEIVEKTEVINGHIVSPHFRSGFFRHYTDDRYINMKGKVQFIAATMVKGKAKTVVA